jgi:hypothetical protein
MGLRTTQDIGILLHKCRNRINMVGIELEGGWDSTRPLVNQQIIRDGSVKFDPPQDVIKAINAYPPTDKQIKLVEEWKAKPRPQYIGELPSPPIKPDIVEKWVKVHFPNFVNKTCGLHIHMSFHHAFHYMVLMTSEYQERIVEYLRLWASKEDLPRTHPLWERLEGKSEYCQLLYIADAQSRLERKAYDRNVPVHRYTAINYSHATHGTVECRLLPMFDSAEQSIRALKEVMAITNAFLVSTARREEKHEVLVKFDGDETVEELKESA